MALLNPASPSAKPCPENSRNAWFFFSQIPNLRTASLSKGFPRCSASAHIATSPKDPVFTLPSWEYQKNDQRTNDIKLSEALLYMESMVERGYRPDISQATLLLYDLCRMKKLKKAARVMEMMVMSGSPPDESCHSFLVKRLCRRGNVGYAIQLVERMEDCGYRVTTCAYNSLLRGLCVCGNLNQSLQLLDRLIQKGLVPNVFTFTIILEAVCKERGVDEAIRHLDGISANGGEPNLVSYNVILTGLCREGRIGEAMPFFRNMPFSPNTVSYNILLWSLCYDGQWEEARELLSEMDGGDRSPSLVTYNILIGALAFHGFTDQALEVLDEMAMARQFRPTAATYNPLITRLCEDGKVALVVRCLDQMLSRRCSPNEGTYSALSILCKTRTVLEAFSMIQGLGERQGVIPREFYAFVVASLCRKGKTLAALQLLYEMIGAGFTPDSFTYSSLIRGLCVEGMLDEALEIIMILEERGCSKPCVGNFNALILGLCKSGRTEFGIRVFEMMVMKGYSPNETTYCILVEGVAHEGESGLASEVLEELYVRQVLPRNAVERLVMQYDLNGLQI